MQEFLEGTVLLTWNSDVKVKLRHYMYCIHVFEATIYLIWVMSNVKHMHVSQCKFSTLKACSQYKCCCQVVVHSEGWGENGRKQTGDEASSGGHSWEAELSDQEWVSMNKIESKYSVCDIIHSELTLYDRGYIVWNFGIYRNHGQSQYGILSMQWITDIPISNAPVASTPRAYPRSESSTSQVTDRSMDANTVKSMGRNTSRLPRLAQKYSKINVSRYA